MDKTAFTLQTVTQALHLINQATALVPAFSLPPRELKVAHGYQWRLGPTFVHLTVDQVRDAPAEFSAAEQAAAHGAGLRQHRATQLYRLAAAARALATRCEHIAAADTADAARACFDLAQRVQTEAEEHPRDARVGRREALLLEAIQLLASRHQRRGSAAPRGTGKGASRAHLASALLRRLTAGVEARRAG